MATKDYWADAFIDRVRTPLGCCFPTLDAIISKDLNGIIATWNLGAQNLFGYSAQEAIGKPITMLIAPERMNEEPNILNRITQGKHVGYE